MTVFWTPARENQLEALVRAGLSAGKIGAALGCSRNAVIGKIMRGKGRFGMLSGWAGRRCRVEVRPRKPVADVPALAPVGLPAARSAVAVPMPKPASARPPAQSVPFLRAVEEGLCLWFAGDARGPDGPGMPVCGGERASGIRYCAHHADRARRREPA